MRSDHYMGGELIWCANWRRGDNERRREVGEAVVARGGVRICLCSRSGLALPELAELCSSRL